MNEPTVKFQEFPKIARLMRDVIVTEKIDGTNAQVLISDDGSIKAGSRNRWITPQDDNYGFAAWVEGNKETLLKLGPSRHFGEWWGSGIQRRYGLTEKRWSLFNTHRWCPFGTTPQRIPQNDPRVEKFQDVLPEGLFLVPVIWTGQFNLLPVTSLLDRLENHGSFAVPGFMNPEGMVVFHTAGQVGFKVTLENDETPKSLVK